MRCQHFLLLLTLACVPAGAPAAEERRLLVRAGRVLDVATGRFEDDRGILVAGERIATVGPFESVRAAAPAVPLVDLSRFTVLPGLIDGHAHVLGNPKDYSATQPLRLSSAQQVLWGVANLRVWLDHGFTTIRDAGETDAAYGQLALKEAVERGLVPGPRIYAAGSFVSLTGGHGDANVLAPDQPLPRMNVADTVDDVARVVRRDLKYGADWIKLMGTGGILDPFSDFDVQELSEEQMAKAVEIAHRAGRRVMVHAEGSAGIKAAVRAGVDSIEHGTLLDEEGAALMERKGTWLVPTLYTFQYGAQLGEKIGLEPVMLAKVRRIVSNQGPAFSRALAHHVRVVFGLDLDPEHLPKEFEALVAGGLTPLQAIQAATTNAAELLGKAGELGAIAKGRFADLVAVEGDPTKDVTILANVTVVMKGGTIVKDARNGRDASMIMRIWHGWTPPENADAYEKMLVDEILPGIHRIGGYRGAWLLRRPSAEGVEFVTITTWDSWKAIEEFAGPGRNSAVIYPKAHALMSRFDETSEHYEASWVP